LIPYVTSASLIPYTTLFRSHRLPGYRSRTWLCGPLCAQVRVERVGVQAFALHIGAGPFGGGVLLRGLLRQPVCIQLRGLSVELGDRQSTRLNSSHVSISYAV